MPIVLKKVSINVELRVQWSGTPDPFFGRTVGGQPGEFPGLEVPTALCEAVRRLRGQIMAIDSKKYPMSAEKELKRLFQASCELTDTPGNQVYGLYNGGHGTTSGGNWRQANADSLAFKVGTTKLKADGTPDPAAKMKVLEVPHTQKDGSQVVATFWVGFQLVKEGW
jgi:hypothetical protein